MKVITAALVLWAGIAAAQSPPAPALGPATQRLMVIPFEETGAESRAYWLGEGSAVALTDDLTAMAIPAITRDDRLHAFDRLRVPANARLSYATIIRLGQIVGATQVVVGSYDVTDKALTVRVRVIGLDTGRMSAEMVEEGPLADLFAIYGRVARRIAPGSQVSMEEMEQGHPSVAAFEQYIKGVLAEAPDARVMFLTQALTLAPTFQRARIALWDAHNEQGEHQQALIMVRQVPPEHRLGRKARFLTAISLTHLARYQEAYETLTALNQAAPDPAVLNDLGVVQLRRPANAPGGRAVSYFSEAAQLDSSDADLFFNLGYASWVERDAPSTIAALREAVRRNAADGEAHFVLALALQASGSTAEAAREKELAKRLSSVFSEWEARQPANPVPRGLERLKTDIDVPASLRLETIIDASVQREQRELAAFHLDTARRLAKDERDAEAIAELRRAIYLAPYESEAHLLLGRIYLRAGRSKEAVDALKISIWSEDTVAAHVVLAEAFLAEKDSAAARAELQSVLRREPTNAEARQLLDRADLR